MRATTVWINTPGYYYAIGYILASILTICTSARRRQGVKLGAGILAYAIVLTVIMVVSDGSEAMLFIPFIILYWLLMGGLIGWSTRYDWMTTIYLSARTFIIGEFIASLSWQIVYFARSWKILPDTATAEVLLLIVICGSCLALLYWLERKNIAMNQQLRISGRELFSALTISIAVFFASNMSYVLRSSAFGSRFVSDIFIVRTLVDLGGVASLYAFHVQLRELKARFEVQKLQEMLQMQHHNYEVLESSIAAVNQKYHDLKYQIALLKENVTADQGLAYLEQMERDIKSYEAQNKTGNKILDTLLTAKELYCQEHWISLTSVVEGEALCFMDPFDLSTMFGNMLDNAIESVAKVEQKEKRLIHLAVAKQKGFVRIRLENCYQGELTFADGLPQTTKQNKLYHGYGLKSIKSIAAKYGGVLDIDLHKDWFELRILIPVNDGPAKPSIKTTE